MQSRVYDLKQKFSFETFSWTSNTSFSDISLGPAGWAHRSVNKGSATITKTETTTFTGCVNCLTAFANSRFNKDISLNAIAFLHFCAAKLAEGILVPLHGTKTKMHMGHLLLQQGKMESKVLWMKMIISISGSHCWLDLLNLALILGLRSGRVFCRCSLIHYAIMVTPSYYLFRSVFSLSFSPYLIMFGLRLVLLRKAYLTKDLKMMQMKIKMHGFMRHVHLPSN